MTSTILVSIQPSSPTLLPKGEKGANAFGTMRITVFLLSHSWERMSRQGQVRATPTQAPRYLPVYQTYLFPLAEVMPEQCTEIMLKGGHGEAEGDFVPGYPDASIHKPLLTR